MKLACSPSVISHGESGGGGGALGFLLGLSAVGGRVGAGGSGDEGPWEPGVWVGGLRRVIFSLGREVARGAR